MKKRLLQLGKWVITLAIIALSVVWALRDVEGERLLAVFATIDYVWLLVSVPPMIAAHLIRAERWRTLLRPLKEPVSLFNAFSAVMIGNFLNNVIPRGGEIARPYIFGQREQLRTSAVLATVILERAIDVVSLLAVIGVAAWFLHQIIESSFPGYAEASLRALVPLLGLLAALVALIKLPIGERLLAKVLSPFSAAFNTRLRQILESFKQGFAAITTPGLYIRLIGETVLLWAIYALPIYLLLFAFDDPAIARLGYTDGLILTVIGTLAITVAPTPGGVGLYHVTIQTTLVNIYHLSSENAIAFAFVAHTLAYVVNLAFGAVLLLREQAAGISFSLRSAQQAASAGESS